jgi:hypothetical protein
MRLRVKTCTAYSIGCAIAWATVLAIAARKRDKDTLHKLGLFFGGWVSGWTSATSARYVYPPPKARRLSQ